MTTTLDPSITLGPVSAVHGVNLGPMDRDWGRDYTPYFRAAEISSVRLHDAPLLAAQAADLHTIFPNPAADPDDESNYTFGVTDHYLAAIRNAGAEIYFRLGESIEHAPEKVFVRADRWDPEVLAKVCANIVRHYNCGWADGFEWGVKYWEFWNEPDCGSGEKPLEKRACFAGSAEEFLAFYRAVAPAVKQADPSAQIGLAGWTGGWTRAWLAADIDDRDGWAGWLGIMPRAVEEGLPIDFLSWHDYPGTWEQVAELAHGVRARLDALGLTEAESHLTEWCWIPTMRDEAGEYNFMRVRMGTDYERWETAYEYTNGPRGAAFTFGALAEMQELPIDLSHHYTGTSENWGLFRVSGRPTIKYEAFAEFARFLADGNERIAVTEVADDGVRTLAVRTPDGGVRLAVANHDPVPAGFAAQIAGAALNVSSARTLTESGWQEAKAEVVDGVLRIDTTEPRLTVVELH